MKFKILFLVLFSAFATISCKNETSDKNQQSQEVQAVPDAFRVTLDVVAKKNDDFCIELLDLSK